MLRFIRIRDFALIRELEIEFGPGLNLLTGETGSGKSILVDALGLLLGERASQEMVRSGCDQSVLEGVFSVETSDAISQILEDAGIDHEDDLLIRREISSTGRNRVFINNNLATLSLLKALGDRLGDIHGQHDHQALLHPASHLEFLDRFGSNTDLAREVGQHYRKIQEMAQRLESMEMDEQERLKKIDILQYQVDEIRRANLQPQEREELESGRGILTNRERIFTLASEIYTLLYESENSILSQASRVSRALSELAGFDSKWASHSEALSESLYRLEDLAYSARDYTTGMDFSPERLDYVEQRLSELDRLARKYGHSISAILEYAEKCQQELDNLSSLKDRSKQLESDLEAELKQYLKLAERLSEKRRKGAAQLEREIKRELAALSMDKTEFGVRFAPRAASATHARFPDDCRQDGIDQVEFLVSPNKGEELKPMAKIASGGELSRIVLALKSICGIDEAGKTLVFDEVDVGIGGRVAEVVGRRLRAIARNNQVLCVTHLAQIAAFATHHYRVHKETVGSRTETSVQNLNEADRVKELARMLGGETVTETALRHAREMLGHSLSSVRSH